MGGRLVLGSEDIAGFERLVVLEGHSQAVLERRWVGALLP